MSTQAQIQANRRNALNSTGPRTPEGKSRSSANALKHGLSARFRVLTSENQDDFDDLLAATTRKFAPTDAYEEVLVLEIAQSHWRLIRFLRFEADMVDDMAACHCSSDHEGTLRSLMLNDKAGPFHILQRHAAAAERSGQRAVKQLLALRKLDAQAARLAAQPAPAQQNEPNSATSPSTPVRCESPNGAAPANQGAGQPPRPMANAPEAPSETGLRHPPTFTDQTG
jgi:hypothetical protein